MPSLTVKQLASKIVALNVVRSLTPEDIATQVLVLMQLWQEKFSNDSLPREMNRVLRERR